MPGAAASDTPFVPLRRGVRRRGARWTIVTLLVCLVWLFLTSLTLGRLPVPLQDVLSALFALVRPQPALDPTSQMVVQALRLPRALMSTFAGMGLGLTGAALQGVFRNPLVGPQVIGVSSGAAFGGALAILMSASSAALLSGAFLFGLLATLLVLVMGQLFGRGNIIMLVLAGIVVSGFFGALTALTEFFADPDSQLPSIVFWLLGSFATARIDKIPLIAGPTVIGGAILLMMRWHINVLSMGDDEARALGAKVQLSRWLLLAAVALVVAGQVAVSGVVGWVGLVVPHLARSIVGSDHRDLLPASTLLGGISMLLIDTLARTVSATEIPLGVITALIGTPFFAFLLYRLKGRGWMRE